MDSLVNRVPHTLHGFFEGIVDQYPEHLAIEVPAGPKNVGSIRLSYAQVNEQANALATLIQKTGSGERVVAIYLPRVDQRVFIAQLAALKAGAAYLCLDPSFPPDRLKFTLEDSAPDLLITDSECAGDLALPADSAFPVLDYNRDFASQEMSVLAADFRAPVIESDRLAYIIYTSGTTGQPKGVMVEHRNIVNLLSENLSYFDVGPDDRVAQNSSTAYDSSVEETYLAFATGAALVLASDEVVRMGPDLPSWLVREGITVFCPPPTLLRTMGGQPASESLRHLRLLYTGGEAITPDLVRIWAPGRHLENGYGPTECAVTVTRTRLKVSDDQVTIGQAVWNNQAWILDDADQPIDDDRPGELCISGVSVTRGYLNRPDLTAERFPHHPICGRIYRTGDLVSRGSDGQLTFLGRIDTQVKLRGYRVELADIESHILALPEIESAACVVQGTGGVQQLVAFLVPRASHCVDIGVLRRTLAEQLPPYMVPARFELIDAMPTSTSGKLNRKALPQLSRTVHREGEMVLPTNPLEALIAETFAVHLDVHDGVSIDDDFFALGGDSLLGAVVISSLRGHPETAELTMRDVYECRTVARLAERARIAQGADEAVIPPSDGPEPAVLNGHVLMLGWLFFGTCLSGALSYLLGFVALPFLLKHVSILVLLVGLVLLRSTVSILWLPFSVLFAVFLKRLLIGRYQAGRHPVWGPMYVRHWLVKQMVRGIPWGLVAGTEFHCMVLRALGAQIGEGVHFHKGVHCFDGGWDLLCIEDGVSLGRDVALRLVDYERGHMVVGPIHIGQDSTLETRSGVSAHTHVAPGTYLTAHSWLTPNTTMPPDGYWDGLPAECIQNAPKPLEDVVAEHTYQPIEYGIRFILLGRLLALAGQLPIFLGLLVLILMTSVDSQAVDEWLFATHGLFGSVVASVLGLVSLTILVQLPISALLCRFLGRVQPGRYPRHGVTSMKVWFKDSLVSAANRWLSGTLFWPTWLRASGMAVGRNSEISTIMEVVPELVDIEGQCFFADGIYLGGPRYHRGAFSLDRVRLSPNTFLGNHAVIHGGSCLPPDVLLGICTVADPKRIKPDTGWFGHPAFLLPNREVIECDRRLTHNPSAPRYVQRCFWEVARFALPALPTFLVLVYFKTLTLYAEVLSPLVFYPVFILVYPVLLGSILLLATIALKWVLLGRGRAGQHPLWSSWCSRWDFLYVAWGMWARPLARNFEGTLLVNCWLRLFGVRLGRRVFLGEGFAQVVDPDMLNFEAGSTVVNLFQAHSFEDRVLKKAPVYIRSGATVRGHAVILYGADIGQDAIVSEQSVVMKNEYLRPERYYTGAPTRPQSPPVPSIG